MQTMLGKQPSQHLLQSSREEGCGLLSWAVGCSPVPAQHPPGVQVMESQPPRHGCQPLQGAIEASMGATSPFVRKGKARFLLIFKLPVKWALRCHAPQNRRSFNRSLRMDTGALCGLCYIFPAQHVPKGHRRCLLVSVLPPSPV